MAGYWPSSFMRVSGQSSQKKKERGQYPATLLKKAWSIKDLLFGFQGNLSHKTRRVVPSGQSQHAIWFILPTDRASSCHMIKMGTGKFNGGR